MDETFSNILRNSGANPFETTVYDEVLFAEMMNNTNLIQGTDIQINVSYARTFRTFKEQTNDYLNRVRPNHPDNDAQSEN